MSTTIKAFFPHSIERPPEAVRERLVRVFGDLQEDLAVIRARGKYSADSGDWWLILEDGIVSGEGPSGFSCIVNPSVVEFTSVEHFGAIQHPDAGINLAIRRVFEAVAAAFGGRGHLAVAPGGFGETDRASDTANDGGGFAEVCDCLEKVIGPPARSWELLQEGQYCWYLSDVDALPDADCRST